MEKEFKGPIFIPRDVVRVLRKDAGIKEGDEVVVKRGNYWYVDIECIDVVNGTGPYYASEFELIRHGELQSEVFN